MLMVLTSEVAFYHKIGTISDNKHVFKYFMASLSPHFYFVIYVVPYVDHVDIFYIPKVDNLDSFAIVPLFDSSYGSVENLAYGDTVTIALANEKIHGMAEVIEVDVRVPDKPIVLNDLPASFMDMELSRQIASSAIAELERINLFTLANQVGIFVGSKMQVLYDATPGIDIEAATYSIIQQLISDKFTFYSSLPYEMIDERKAIMYRMMNIMMNVSPYSIDIVSIFTDIISFARSLHDGNILFETIPYKVFYRLSYNALSSGSTDSVTDIGVAALAATKSQTVGINMATMEEQSKVYEFINITQAFVYLTSIEFKNIESGDIKVMVLDNESPDVLTRRKDICIEARSIQADGIKVTIQYGYGAGCDYFIGVLFEDEFGNYGITREDKLLDGDAETARKWEWGENSLEMFGNEIDSSNNIEVTFTGV